jgi:protein phosphatase
MGTTITAAHVGVDEVALAHVGDSRAYCLRDGELRRLTEDHSLVEELVRQGKLTEQEAQDHPQRSIITRALGPEPDVDVDTLTFRARPGDVFLLCSDGLTGMVSEDQVREIIVSSPSLEAAGQKLIAAANAAGGRDNITVVLFRLEDVSAPTAAPETTDQPTAVGEAAPSVDEVREALARTPEPVVAARQPRRLVPRMPGGERRPAGRPRRRMPVAVRALLALAVVVVLLVVGGWIATQTVYFVGTDSRGQVTVYRGLPYDLPAGISLYQPNFVSGVTVAELSSIERRRLLSHKLRSAGDATDLVRRLELNEISQQ